MFRVNWVAGCIGFAAALATAESIRFGLGQLRNPGPGLFPFIAGLLLLILSFTLVIKEFPCTDNLKGLISKQRIVIVLALISPILIFENLGFCITIFLLFMVLLRIFGFKRWSIIGGIAGLTALISYLLFYSLLGMVLP